MTSSSTAIACVVVFLVAASFPPAQGGVKADTAQRDGHDVLVLENEQARIEVWPEAGGAITSFIDKRSGVDFVAGQATPGAAAYAWKDVTRLHAQDPPDRWMGAMPYDAGFRDSEHGTVILATAEQGHLRVEREMRLADSGTALFVTIRHLNVSDEPKSTWLRWHPYMKLDDELATDSMIVIPGPDAHSMRKIRNGVGYEAHFMDVPGY